MAVDVTQHGLASRRAPAAGGRQIAGVALDPERQHDEINDVFTAPSDSIALSLETEFVERVEIAEQQFQGDRVAVELDATEGADLRERAGDPRPRNLQRPQLARRRHMNTADVGAVADDRFAGGNYPGLATLGLIAAAEPAQRHAQGI